MPGASCLVVAGAGCYLWLVVGAGRLALAEAVGAGCYLQVLLGLRLWLGLALGLFLVCLDGVRYLHICTAAAASGHALTRCLISAASTLAKLPCRVLIVPSPNARYRTPFSPRITTLSTRRRPKLSGRSPVRNMTTKTNHRWVSCKEDTPTSSCSTGQSESCKTSTPPVATSLNADVSRHDEQIPAMNRLDIGNCGNDENTTPCPPFDWSYALPSALAYVLDYRGFNLRTAYLSPQGRLWRSRIVV